MSRIRLRVIVRGPDLGCESLPGSGCPGERLSLAISCEWTGSASAAVHSGIRVDRLAARVRRSGGSAPGVIGGSPGRQDDGPSHSLAGLAIDLGVGWLAMRSLRAHSATLQVLTARWRFLRDLTPTWRLRHAGEKNAGPLARAPRGI